MIKRYSTLSLAKEEAIIALEQLSPNATGGASNTGQPVNKLNELMATDPEISLLRTKLAEATIELKQKSDVLSEKHPTIVALKQNITETQNQIRDAVEKYYAGKSGELGSINKVLNGYDAGIAQFPSKKLEYARLVRDQEIETKIYGMMRAEYEKARLQEKSKDFTLTVLDKGSLPMKKSYPPTVRNTLFCAGASFIVFSYLFIFIDLRKRPVKAA
jgi:uncharacterized protein involved in exopolysaccharide biosynthesis